MNHDILFRGKRIDTGKCVYGYYIQLNSSNETLHIIVDDHGEYHRVNPSTVGQFTGLTDKNGRKIFEGDIIKGKGKEVFAVEYSRNIAGFITKGFGVLCCPCMNTGTMEFYEVVGNIRGDQELLGGDNNA